MQIASPDPNPDKGPSPKRSWGAGLKFANSLRYRSAILRLSNLRGPTQREEMG
jgi:hypothetical protein